MALGLGASIGPRIGEGADLELADQGNRQGEREHGPAAVASLDPDAAPVGFDEALGDEQAQPGTRWRARPAAVAAEKLAEDRQAVLLGDALALVRDTDADLGVLDDAGDVDLAGVGVLRRGW